MGCRPIFQDLALYPMYFNGFQFFSPGSFVCGKFPHNIDPVHGPVQGLSEEVIAGTTDFRSRIKKKFVTF